MNLTKSSLKSPASVLVILTLIVLFGTITIFKLPIQLTPTIEQPQISIFAGWRQAAPEEIESVIIEPIENTVKNTPGALEVTTQIFRGRGSINLTFEVGADMQQAMLDVLTSLNQTPPLPIDAMEPVVVAGGGGNGAGGGGSAAASLLVVPQTDDVSHDMAMYQKVLDDIVKPRLNRVPGVSAVNMQSQRPKELRIDFDPYKAATFGISLGQIANTLATATDVSGGVANVGRRQYTVRFTGKFTPNNLADMRIGYSNGRPIYLRDVATVSETYTDRQALTLRNGKPAYYITISRTNNSNTVAVLDGINQAIKELNEGALGEEGLSIELSYDASVHIRNALDLVKSNLGLGVLLALGILYLFFRGIKPTLVIAATIPVSLMLAFLGLGIFERTINVISLAGLAFSVGLVLDAAIIVQENISRLIAGGMPNKKAVLRGATQVSGALFASTSTSVAIFLPILFMAGIEGQLFSDLALTLSIAVIASMISALTIIPLANRYLIANSIQEDRFAKYWQRLAELVTRLTNSRVKQLSWISGIMLGSVLIIVLLMPKTDFMPRAPTDGFFYSLITPPGGNIDFMEEEIASRVRARLMPYYLGEKGPKIKDFNFYVFGSNAGGFVYSEDPTRVEELMATARNEIFADLPDTRVFLFRGSMIQVANGGNGRMISIDFTGSNLDDLYAIAQSGLTLVNEKMAGATAQPVPNLDLSEPELRIEPNDRRITQAGLSRRDVARAIQAFTSGMFVNEYFNGNDRLNVILRANHWSTPEELATLPIHTPDAGIQTLGELATITRTVGPSQLRRIDGKRTVSIQVTPPPDMSLQEAQAILSTQVVEPLKAQLKGDASVILGGNAQKMNSAIEDMSVNFLLALFILFLLMTALFKSAVDSVFVLLVMPMAIAGGVIAMAILNLFTVQSLDLLTMVGFIILLGLVVNNAILLVDQTRNAQKEGMTTAEAVNYAVLIRARPVYLSTLTSLFGMLPLMLVPGVGSEIYRGLATVIVGGMGICAIFTLILMPCLLLLSGQKQVVRQHQENVAAIN